MHVELDFANHAFATSKHAVDGAKMLPQLTDFSSVPSVGLTCDDS